MNIYNISSIYGLYNTMYQGSTSLNSIKLNRDYFQTDQKQSSSQLGGEALKYINGIKLSSKNIGTALKDLSGAAFTKKPTDSTEQNNSSKDRAIVAVEKLVKNYNDLYVEAVKRTNDQKAQNLASKMINISKTYSGSLSKVGIGFDGDGKMTLDTKKLNEALENGSLEQFFTQNNGKNYGFTNQLSRLADNVSSNTSNYVSRSEFGSDLTENFAYSSYGSLLQYNYLSTGWLFDYAF